MFPPQVFLHKSNSLADSPTMLATRMSRHVWNKKEELLGRKLCAKAATQPAQYLPLVSPHHREWEKGFMDEHQIVEGRRSTCLTPSRTGGTFGIPPLLLPLTEIFSGSFLSSSSHSWAVKANSLLPLKHKVISKSLLWQNPWKRDLCQLMDQMVKELQVLLFKNPVVIKPA